MLLVEARKNDLILHNMNNKDLFSLLQIVLDQTITKREAKKKAIQYSEEYKPDKSVIMTVAGAANMKLDYNALMKGESNMCTLFEKIAKEGEMKGEIRGEIRGEARGIIETGFDFGISESDILDRLQKKLNVSLEVA